MSELDSKYRPMSAKEKVVHFATNVRNSIRNAFDGVADRLMPKRLEKREEEKQFQLEVFSRAVARAKNWRQLFQATELIGSIPTTASPTPLGAAEVKECIHAAYHSNDKMLNANLVPSAYGLRDKYVELASLPVHNANFSDPAQASTEQLPNWNEFIRHGGSFAIRDPEKYDSKTVDAAVSEICIRFHSLRENKQTMQSLILLAANVVDEAMPYDFVGKGAAADHYAQITQAIAEAKLGVCRHQAPVLTTILKRLGFNAHQVWNDWRGQREGHTLAYISDPSIKAFVNPGSSFSKETFIPKEKYPRHAYNWRIRDAQDQWVSAPQLENTEKSQNYSRPTSRIVAKLFSLFSGRK